MGMKIVLRRRIQGSGPFCRGGRPHSATCFYVGLEGRAVRVDGILSLCHRSASLEDSLATLEKTLLILHVP